MIRYLLHYYDLSPHKNKVENILIECVNTYTHLLQQITQFIMKDQDIFLFRLLPEKTA